MSKNKHDIDKQLYNLNKTVAHLCEQYMKLDTTVRGFFCLQEIIKTTPEIKNQIMASINQTPASPNQTFANDRMSENKIEQPKAFDLDEYLAKTNITPDDIRLFIRLTNSLLHSHNKNITRLIYVATAALILSLVTIVVIVTFAVSTVMIKRQQPINLNQKPEAIKAHTTDIPIATHAIKFAPFASAIDFSAYLFDSRAVSSDWADIAFADNAIAFVSRATARDCSTFSRSHCSFSSFLRSEAWHTKPNSVKPNITGAVKFPVSLNNATSASCWSRSSSSMMHLLLCKKLKLNARILSERSMQKGFSPSLFSTISLRISSWTFSSSMPSVSAV